MKLEDSRVFKIPVQTSKQFAKDLQVSSTAIYYAMANGLVDYIEVGDRRFVAMTKTTRQYKPNDSPNRVVIKKRKRKKV